MGNPINLNVILSNYNELIKASHSKTKMIFSGFLRGDTETIKTRFIEASFKSEMWNEQEEWVYLQLISIK